MRYERAPALKAVLTDVVIEAGPKEAQRHDQRRYSIETTARVTFTWPSRQSMERMYSDLDAVEALLWTVLDQPSLARSIVALDNRYKARVFGGRSKVVQPIEVRTMLRTPATAASVDSALPPARGHRAPLRGVVSRMVRPLGV